MAITTAIHTTTGEIIILDSEGGTIADGSITTDKLADGSITTDKLADYAVTEDKISNTIYAIKNYLPSGTVINVASTGGDFTNLADAVAFLTNKWSDGTVTIQLADETFEMTTVININSDLFNIPILKIKGDNTNLKQLTVEAAALFITGSKRIDIETINFIGLRGIKFDDAYCVNIKNCNFNDNDYSINLDQNSNVVVVGGTFNTCPDPFYCTRNSSLLISGITTINCTRQATASSNSKITYTYTNTLNNDIFSPALNTISILGCIYK